MPTRLVLLATLAATAAAVADVVRRAELPARAAVTYLLVLTFLFLLRVVGQVVVWRRSPAWLPPMQEWNLVPYHVLLPIQVGFLLAMVAIAVTLERVEPRATFGRVLITLAIVYAAGMVVRYAVRMRRRPEARWFGGAIPIVIHLVLAAFLLTWGSYHVSA
jgi:uncharacterized membrane protein HdeD (DUF308 family)